MDEDGRIAFISTLVNCSMTTKMIIFVTKKGHESLPHAMCRLSKNCVVGTKREKKLLVEQRGAEA